MKSKTRVLVYQLGSIGDTVISIPALKAIRRHFGPDAEICLLHEIRSQIKTTPADILGGNPEIDRFIGYPLTATPGRKLLSAAQVARRLRQERFQVVVYLAPSERSAARIRRDALFFRLSGIPEHIGFHAFLPQMLYKLDAHDLAPHEAWLRLERIRRDGIDVSVEMDLTKPYLSLPIRFIDEVRKWLSGHRTSPHFPLVAISPGCKQPANVWPIERFVELGQRLVRQGGVEIVVVGGPAERGTAQKMIDTWGTGLNAAGEFPPLGSAALLAECAFMVGLDTGTTHLAAAQGIPCVALYGCREEAGRFYPLGNGHIILRHSVSCAGCRLIETPCTLAEHPCMRGITVDEVWAAVRETQTARQVSKIA